MYDENNNRMTGFERGEIGEFPSCVVTVAAPKGGVLLPYRVT